MTTEISGSNGGWGNAAKGAAGGAAAGAALGPWGALVGGVAGGAIGYFSGGENDADALNRKRLEDYYNQVNGRQAPQMTGAAQAGYSNFRGNQRDLINRLDAQSRGQGPSLAAEQMKSATDRNIGQQSAFANSGRGGPLAAQVAATNSGRLGAQSAQDSMQGRIAEQQNALQLLGLNIHGARGQDEDVNRFNAGAQNDVALANLNARLKTMGMNDEQISRILQQLGGQNAAANNKVSTGDQIMAGGAGMYAQYQAQKNAGQQQGVDPSSGYQPGFTNTYDPRRG